MIMYLTWKKFSSSLIAIIFLPEHYVDAEYLESLPDNNSINENTTTNFCATTFWVVYPFSKKILIVIDEERREGSTPEEEEAHAKVENGVKMFSSPYFTSKNVV